MTSHHTASTLQPQTLIDMYTFKLLNVTQGEKIVKFLNQLVQYPAMFDWALNVHREICDMVAVRHSDH